MKDQPRSYKKLWLALFATIALSFLALGYFGREIYHLVPPIPQRVVTTDGTVLFTGQDIKDGQNVWQSIGGEEVGTIWGHGAYVAPDWSADWLHRECVTILDKWAQADSGKTYDQLDAEKQAALRERLPFRHRRADIYALAAEDHYLRVHTSAGDALILMRLYDAIRELDGIEGSQTHRSWWVAKNAVADAARGGGKAALTLKNGLCVPVSRSYVKALKQDGWL